MAIVLGNEPPGLVNKLHFIPLCHFWLKERREMKAEMSKALLLTQGGISHFQALRRHGAPMSVALAGAEPRPDPGSSGPPGLGIWMSPH